MIIRIIAISWHAEDGNNPLLHLTQFGGVNEDTSDLQFYSMEEMYHIVEKESNSVYVKDIWGNKLQVIAAISMSGVKYVRSSLNDDKPDELLKLPTCSMLNW